MVNSFDETHFNHFKLIRKTKSNDQKKKMFVIFILIVFKEKRKEKRFAIQKFNFSLPTTRREQKVLEKENQVQHHDVNELLFEQFDILYRVNRRYFAVVD